MCLHCKGGGGGCERDRDACAYVVVGKECERVERKHGRRRKENEHQKNERKKKKENQNQRRTGTASSRSKKPRQQTMAENYHHRCTEQTRRAHVLKNTDNAENGLKRRSRRWTNPPRRHGNDKHQDTCVEKHSGEEGFRTLTNISKAHKFGETQKKDREHKIWVTTKNTNKHVQDRNKWGMFTVLSTVVESWTSSTCFRAGILRQAQSACSTTCSFLRQWWRASRLGTGYTSCLCCCRQRLSCDSTTSLCTPPCCPPATTHTSTALCCFCTYGLASTAGGCETAAWMTWQ